MKNLIWLAISLLAAVLPVRAQTYTISVRISTVTGRSEDGVYVRRCHTDYVDTLGSSGISTQCDIGGCYYDIPAAPGDYFLYLTYPFNPWTRYWYTGAGSEPETIPLSIPISCHIGVPQREAVRS